MENYNNFVHYINEEFCPEPATSINKSYMYSQSIAKDGIVKNTITCVFKYYDEEHKLLRSLPIKFTNGSLSKQITESIQKISYKELENKFMLAKSVIVHKIIEDCESKMNELSDKITLLNEYKLLEDAGIKTTKETRIKQPTRLERAESNFVNNIKVKKESFDM